MQKAVALGVEARMVGPKVRVPFARSRRQHLSFTAREEIALFNAQCEGVREIARWLGRDLSTVLRKLRRNGATRGGQLSYRASIAQWKAELMARGPKTPNAGAVR